MKIDEKAVFVPLGPAPKKTIPQRKGPKPKDADVSVQESLGLPSIEESFHAKDVLYIIQLLEEISSRVEALEERLNENKNPSPSGDTKKKEEVDHV